MEQALSSASPCADQATKDPAVVGNEGSEAMGEASGVVRRYSLADFTNLRGRSSGNIHVSGAGQLKGLVIPSPVIGGADGSKSSSSSCVLPTIAGSKPQFKSLLTTAAQQQRRGSSSYQSVLTGVPFISSGSRSTAAFGVHRRSSVCGYPPHQRSSAGRSLVEPSAISVRANSSRGSKEATVRGDTTGFPSHDGDVLRKRPLARINSEAEDAWTTTLFGACTSPTVDEEQKDERVSSRQIIDKDTSSSSNRFPASSAAGEPGEPGDVLTSESIQKNSGKSERHGEEAPATISHDRHHTDTQSSTFDTANVADDHSSLPTSGVENLTESELTVERSEPHKYQSVSVDNIDDVATSLQSTNGNDQPSVLHVDKTETAVDEVQGTPADSTSDELQNWYNATSAGRQQPDVVDKLNGNVEFVDQRTVLQSDDSSLINVTVNKGNLGLGFCITGGRGSTAGDLPIVIKRIFKGDTLLETRLQPGDEILTANGVDFSAMSQHEAWTTLKSLPLGPVLLQIRRK